MNNWMRKAIALVVAMMLVTGAVAFADKETYSDAFRLPEVKQKTPVEETPVDETPVEETPVDETPVDETPVDETPVDETPVEETPVEETPVDETPVEPFTVSIGVANEQESYSVGDVFRLQSFIEGECIAPAYQWQVKNPADANAEWVDIEGATEDYYEFVITLENFFCSYRVVVVDTAKVVEETPVEETPVEETPVEETPVEETPVEETPVEETPVEETPAENTEA